MSVLDRWRSEPNRLRRRLLVWSAPVAGLILLVVLKCVSVAIAGNSAVSNFEDRDAAALSSDVAIMQVLNVIEPEKAHFAAGAGAVLDDRLDDAERAFSEALALSAADRACPAGVNLELVQETLGDRAAAAFEGAAALARYQRAVDTVEQAPPGCFTGNDDPDLQRRAVRNDTLPRLEAKIEAARVAPPPPPVAPPPRTAPPPPAAGGAGEEDDDNVWRLHPDAGEPLDRLEQILRDGAVSAQR